jgi:hypothetical protein
MGHADRDFLQESREDEWKHRGPFGSREHSATSIATISFALLALACFAYFAWNMWSGKATTTAPAPASAPQSAVAPALPPRITTPGPQNGTAVVKCVVNGTTTYVASRRDCPAQAEITSVAIDPRMNLSDGLPNAAQIIRRPSPYAAPEPVAPRAVAADANVQRKNICHYYDEEVKLIDARARQPLSPQEQDQLAAKRRHARDEQFRLQCYLVTGF